MTTARKRPGQGQSLAGGGRQGAEVARSTKRRSAARRGPRRMDLIEIDAKTTGLRYKALCFTGIDANMSRPPPISRKGRYGGRRGRADRAKSQSRSVYSPPSKLGRPCGGDLGPVADRNRRWMRVNAVARLPYPARRRYRKSAGQDDRSPPPDALQTPVRSRKLSPPCRDKRGEADRA